MHLTSLTECQSFTQPTWNALRTLTLLAHTLTMSQEASICNCLPLFFSLEAGETDGRFVDVIEHKNKKTQYKKKLHWQYCKLESTRCLPSWLLGWLELRFAAAAQHHRGGSYSILLAWEKTRTQTIVSTECLLLLGCHRQKILSLTFPSQDCLHKSRVGTVSPVTMSSSTQWPERRQWQYWNKD